MLESLQAEIMIWRGSL